MDCPHEQEAAVLAEALARQDQIMAVLVWRLGGQAHMSFEEIQHVKKTYELERSAKADDRKGEVSFKLKVR